MLNRLHHTLEIPLVISRTNLVKEYAYNIAFVNMKIIQMLPQGVKRYDYANCAQLQLRNANAVCCHEAPLSAPSDGATYT